MDVYWPTASIHVQKQNIYLQILLHLKLISEQGEHSPEPQPKLSTHKAHLDPQRDHPRSTRIAPEEYWYILRCSLDWLWTGLSRGVQEDSCRAWLAQFSGTGTCGLFTGISVTLLCHNKRVDTWAWSKDDQKSSHDAQFIQSSLVQHP